MFIIESYLNWDCQEFKNLKISPPGFLSGGDENAKPINRIS